MQGKLLSNTTCRRPRHFHAYAYCVKRYAD